MTWPRAAVETATLHGWHDHVTSLQPAPWLNLTRARDGGVKASLEAQGIELRQTLPCPEGMSVHPAVGEHVAKLTAQQRPPKTWRDWEC